MKVLQEILKWSVERPGWQRDALRRLVTTGDLTDDDIRALTEICKAGHGLAEKAESTPLSKEHVPDGTGTASAVSLESIFHHNRLTLPEDELLKNVHRIQEVNSIEKVASLQGREFSIEMETGTGKTYV